MCELEYNEKRAAKDKEKIEPLLFTDIIKDRLARMQNEFENLDEDSQGKKPRLHEDISRLESWSSEFNKIVKLYYKYSTATQNKIDANIGHDDAEVVQGFDMLIELFNS